MLDGKRQFIDQGKSQGKIRNPKTSANVAIFRGGRAFQICLSLLTFLQSAAWIDGNSKNNLQQFDNSGALTVSRLSRAAMGRLLDEYLTRFLQLRQTSLR
jgi:hypothetical protein